MSEVRRFFQWIAGDSRGEIVEFNNIEEEDGIVYINFKDGSRINEELVGELGVKTLTGKLMGEIDDPSNPWTFEEKYVGRVEEKWEQNADGEKVCVVPFNPGRKVIDLIPPKKTKSKFGIINNNEFPNVDLSMSKATSNKQESIIKDPVHIMLDKAKKIDTEVDMALHIALPSKSLIEVIKESFENGSSKALDYIIDNIDVTLIKEELKKGINILYNGDIVVDNIDSSTITISTNNLGEPIAIEEPEIGEPKIAK